MTTENLKQEKLAVLIDADNTSSAVAQGLFEEIAKYGVASVKRIYGDWSNNTLIGWRSILLKHALTPVQQFAYTKGKDATDMGLIIDAMDLLYSGNFSGFCLVSSDSDFTPLASRIRASGLVVYGFGKEKTPEAFRQACDRFLYVENLGEPKKADTATTALTVGSDVVERSAAAKPVSPRRSRSSRGAPNSCASCSRVTRTALTWPARPAPRAAASCARWSSAPNAG